MNRALIAVIDLALLLGLLAVPSNSKAAEPCPVALYGDSITRRMPAGLMPGAENRGKDGDIIAGVEARLRFDPPAPEATLVLAVGVNDLSARHAKDALSDYEHLLRTRPAVRRTIVSAVLPVGPSRYVDSNVLSARIWQFNQGVQDLARRFGASYIDATTALAERNRILKPGLTVDGVHLSAAGYSAWVAVLAEASSCPPGAK